MSEFTRLSKRSMTFDERKSARPPQQQPQFTMLTRKSQTFVEKSRRSVQQLTRERAPSFQYDDVLFRKHFGQKGSSVDQMPFSAAVLQGVRVQEATVVETATATGEASTKAASVPTISTDKQGKAVVVVDTFTTGAMLANFVHREGYEVICVLSCDLKHLLDMVPEGMEVPFAATIVYDETGTDEATAIASVVEKIRATDLEVLAVMAGAETGVELADALSEAMQLRSNGTTLSESRRNKYIMGETVRAAGLRAVKQLQATTWGEIEAWLQEWQPDPFKVIVKPMDSAGSDDVTLCVSLDQVRAAFGNIMGKVNGLGLVNKAVLVQEFLDGQEYVIDMVSRDGEHKVAAIWAYDRRPANGAGFVCFGQRLLTADEEHCRELVQYQMRVVTALGVVNGPTHGEVKWCRGEPVLVEVGARCHGAEGVWQAVADACYGYNQVEMAIDACLFPSNFSAYSQLPWARLSYGAVVFLIVYVDGTVREVNADLLAEIHSMPSFVAMEIFPQIGEPLRKTIDCFTFGGVMKFVNASREQLEADYARVRDIEQLGLLLC